MEPETKEEKEQEKKPVQRDEHICSSSCPIHHPNKGAIE